MYTNTTLFIKAHLPPDEPSEKIVDVDEVDPQEKSQKTTKVSDKIGKVISELLRFNENLTLGHSLQ